MSLRDFKFGTLDGSSQEVAYEYADEWAVEETTGPSRLLVAPRARHIRLLQALSSVMNEPFSLLYVLVVPRDCGEPGRYQSSEPLSKEELLGFLRRFERFLESDGRHHLWIKSIGESDLLVYDRHNVIYAYGRLGEFEKILRTSAFAETHGIKVPFPHVHCYNQQYDADCRALLNCRKWRHSALHEQDET